MSEVSNRRFVHFDGTKQEFIDGGYPDQYQESIVFINGDGNESNNTIYTHGEYYGQGVIVEGDASNSAILKASGNTATKSYSMAVGKDCTASGSGSHAEGYNTTASGGSSHSEGYQTTASGSYSHAEGYITEATFEGSHAEGYMTDAKSQYGHAEGVLSLTTASGAHAEGGYLSNDIYTKGGTASGLGSHAEGENTISSGKTSHAEGNATISSAWSSHAEGKSTKSTAVASHSEGENTQANGRGSHAEGYATKAIKNFSHTEGYGCTVNDSSIDVIFDSSASKGYYAHAEGNGCLSIGIGSHTEGGQCTASGNYSHAEGYLTISSGLYSHAGGHNTETKSEGSFAHGLSLITSKKYEFSCGKYNNSNSVIFSVGLGTSDDNRYNIFDIKYDGSKINAYTDFDAKSNLNVEGDLVVKGHTKLGNNSSVDKTTITGEVNLDGVLYANKDLYVGKENTSDRVLKVYGGITTTRDVSVNGDLFVSERICTQTYDINTMYLCNGRGVILSDDDTNGYVYKVSPNTITNFIDMSNSGNTLVRFILANNGVKNEQIIRIKIENVIPSSYVFEIVFSYDDGSPFAINNGLCYSCSKYADNSISLDIDNDVSYMLNTVYDGYYEFNILNGSILVTKIGNVL